MSTRHLFTLSHYVIAGRSLGSDRGRIVALIVPALLLGACSDDTAIPTGMGGIAAGGATPNAGGTISPGSGGTGGNGRSGNSGTSGGNTSGSGGSSGATGGGIMDNPEFGFKVPCPPPAQAVILGFASTAAGGDPNVDAGGSDAGAPEPARDTTFGTFGITLAGGTYSYPADGTWPIESDVTQGNWHLSGNVGTYSGFGLYIGGCNALDASAYAGISFTISGSVPMGNALTVNVAISANDVSHVWLNTVAMPPPATPAGVNSGRCIPASNLYDGSCASPTFSVPVTAEPTTVTVLWSQFAGGRPMASVDPREITAISWTFPAPPGAGDPVSAVPYPMDLVIDDIGFIDNP